MSTTMQDPPARLLDLPPPLIEVPPEPVQPPHLSSGELNKLLERLDRFRSAAGTSGLG
jgi:hypothetical protein